MSFSKHRTLNERIRDSQPFFRIRDAEREMEAKTLKDLEFFQKNARRKKINQANLLAGGPPKDGIIKKKKGRQVIGDVDFLDTFNPFVLNTDKSLTKYFVCDEMYYPKVTNTLNLGPHSLDQLYVSGFLDRQQRDSEEIANNRIKETIRKAAVPDVTTKKKPKKKKKNVNDYVETEEEKSEFIKLMESCA